MKLFTHTIIAAATLGMATVAMAADPIVGKWQTYEDGKPKATVKITESSGVISGVITDGNTQKAKGYKGIKVIKNLKADGSGKYSGGKITNPVNGKEYKMTALLKGDTLKLTGRHWSGISKTQTWKRK